jgi:hypothetical protein
VPRGAGFSQDERLKAYSRYVGTSRIARKGDHAGGVSPEGTAWAGGSEFKQSRQIAVLRGPQQELGGICRLEKSHTPQIMQV